MALMLMARGIIVARRRQAEAVDMLGKAIEQPRDLFAALRAALLRRQLAEIIGREVAIVVTVVVVVGTADSLRHRSLLTIRILMWRPIPFSRLNCLARRWR